MLSNFQDRTTKINIKVVDVTRFLINNSIYSRQTKLPYKTIHSVFTDQNSAYVYDYNGFCCVEVNPRIKFETILNQPELMNSNFDLFSFCFH